MRTVSPWADSTKTSGIPLSMRRERYTALTKRRASCPLSDAKVFPGVFCTILCTDFAGQLVEQQPGGKGQPNGHVPRLLYIDSHSVPPFRFEYWLRCWNFTVPAEDRRGGILRRERGWDQQRFFTTMVQRFFHRYLRNRYSPELWGRLQPRDFP